MEFEESTKEEAAHAATAPQAPTDDRADSGSDQDFSDEDPPEVTYSGRQSPDLRPEDVNEIGAGTDAVIYPRDDKNLGEISTLLKMSVHW